MVPLFTLDGWFVASAADAFVVWAVRFSELLRAHLALRPGAARGVLPPTEQIPG